MTNREKAEAWIAANEKSLSIGGKISVRQFVDHLDADAARAGSVIPPDALVTFRDGNKFCAVRGNFKNLQESNAGFGEYREDAIDELLYQEARITPPPTVAGAVKN